MAFSFGYGRNPFKCRNGDLIRSYECDVQSAEEEFLLAKAQYKAITGRDQGDKDVLFYQIRQSFKPGEITHDDALQVGYDLAMRWTKGKHAFFVVSHVDRPHPHIHIYYNSTTLDCKKKFRNFKGSARALRRLSDRICYENGLSVITEPKMKSKGKFKHYDEWAEAQKTSSSPPRRMDLIVDIQAKMREGKGARYTQWASVHNVKAMAAALQYLHENNLLDYADLEVKASNATTRFHELSDKIKTIENAQQTNRELKSAIYNWASTRKIFEGYKTAKYSNKYLAEHEADIRIHREAQAEMKRLLNGKKLPKMDSLKAESFRLRNEKAALYKEYKQVQAEMREVVIAKANIDHLLGITDAEVSPEQAR